MPDRFLWDDGFPVFVFLTLSAFPRMTKISRFAQNDDVGV